jgi:hypothetical protein
MTALQELRELSRLSLLRVFALAGLLAAAGGRCMQLKYCVLDLDIWWHLKVGDWILQHRGFPHTGIFSRTAADRPWVAYSWAYEVLLSLAYKFFGLVGIGLFGVLLTVAVAYAVYWMLRRLSGRFWIAWLLAGIACSAFLFTLMPRPVFFSMILFTVTLTLILEARRSGCAQQLYWLPLIFLLWANIHIQFVYGLFVVGLSLAVSVLEYLAGSRGIAGNYFLPPRLSVKTLAGIFVACTLATCIGPYSFHLYRVILEYSKAQLPYSMIRELQPLNFRYGVHYAQLLLACAGFYAVGWRKKGDLFKLSLLIFASVVAFRTMRDAWFICAVAAACIADSGMETMVNEAAESVLEKAGLAAAVALALLLFARNVDFNSRGLDAAISSQFPVNAVNFMRRNPPPGPLYNSLDWGGFLIWYMPNYEVAIDGRNDLYGDKLDGQFFSSEIGKKTYINDPYLNESGVVLLQRRVPLANILLSDARFRVIYQDQLAMVFVRR